MTEWEFTSIDFLDGYDCKQPIDKCPRCGMYSFRTFRDFVGSSIWPWNKWEPHWIYHCYCSSCHHKIPWGKEIPPTLKPKDETKSEENTAIK